MSKFQEYLTESKQKEDIIKVIGKFWRSGMDEDEILAFIKKNYPTINGEKMLKSFIKSKG